MTDTQAQEAARLADEVEANVLAMMNRQMTVGKMPVEPIIRLVQSARSQAARIAELEKAHAIAVEIGAQYAADREALRAELARMREPLSDDAILHGFCKTPHTNQFVVAFKAGVRFAEAAHGITKTGGGV